MSVTYLDTLDAFCISDGVYGGNPWVLVRMDDGSYFTVWTDQCEVEPCEFGPYPQPSFGEDCEFDTLAHL